MNEPLYLFTKSELEAYVTKKEMISAKNAVSLNVSSPFINLIKLTDIQDPSLPEPVVLPDEGEIKARAKHMISEAVSDDEYVDYYNYPDEMFVAGANYILEKLKQKPLQQKPFGYVFENRFYKTEEDMKGITFHEGNTAVSVYAK